MQQNKRNGIISLWKFIFAIVIVFFHGNQFYGKEKNIFFYGGYIAVEFFFIITGFYLAKKTLKEEYSKENIGYDTTNYVYKRIKSLIPFIVIAYILSIILKIKYSPSLKLNDLINSIWNLLLLREFGFKSILVLNQLWYLSAMIVSTFILYPLIKKYKKNFIYIISPLIVVFGLGYLSYNWLGLDHSYAYWSGFTRTGIIRGFIEVNIGMIIYLIHDCLKNIEFTKIGRLLLTFVGEGLLLCVLIIINYIDAPKYYDYIMLLFISISVLIITSEKTYEYAILSKKPFYYLEKLSMPIYINHIFIINMIDYVPPLSNILPINQSILAVTLTIVFSIIETEIIKIISKKNIIVKFKKIFIKNY